MNRWLKIALLSSLPVVSSAHTASPFVLPEVFDTKAAQNVSFQSAVTIEKFFTPTLNFKTTYLITEPDGQQKAVQPAGILKRFNVAEFDLPKEGTYRIRTDNAMGNSSKFALVDGRWLRVRTARPQPANTEAKPATPAPVAKAPEAKPAAPAQPPRMIMSDKVPADAQILEVTSHLIAESFVTKAKPSPVPAVTNKGFELKFISHPNELYEGESFKAQVLNNGKAVPNLEIDVFKGAGHFDSATTQELTPVKTNAKGEFEVKFDKAGVYLITTAFPAASSDATKKPEAHSYTYGLTVEVTQ